jgi:hypothetical protein
MLLSYPRQLSPIAVIASMLTLTKVLVIAIGLAGLLIGGGYLLARRIVRQIGSVVRFQTTPLDKPPHYPVS